MAGCVDPRETVAVYGLRRVSLNPLGDVSISVPSLAHGLENGGGGKLGPSGRRFYFLGIQRSFSLLCCSFRSVALLLLSFVVKEGIVGHSDSLLFFQTYK